MDTDNKTLLTTVTLNIYEHHINGKTLFSYVVMLPNGIQLTHEFLFGSATDAITKANGRLYGWLKNRKS